MARHRTVPPSRVRVPKGKGATAGKSGAARAAPAGSRALRSVLRGQAWMIALVLAALHLVFAFLFFEPQMHNGGDNAAYLALARSLLEGHGYREIYDPAMPLHTQYPPVFPLMLAALLKLGFQPWVPFKILIVAFSTAAIVLSYFWMRRKLRPELAFVLALLMALSPGVLGLSHWELSDVPFWAFTIGALLAWERLAPHDNKRLLAAITLTLLAYFTRSAGLPLLVAAGGWMLWRKRWKQLAIFALAIAPFAFWWWWRARTQGGVDYVQQFWWINPYQPELGNVGAIDLVRRALANATAYLNRHLPLLLIGQSSIPGIALSYTAAILAVIGWSRRLRHAQVAELFFPLYVGLLLAWPAVWSGERFLVPALPLILFYAAEAMPWLVRRVWPARVRLVSLATAGLILLLSIPALSVGARWGMMCMQLYVQGDPYACHTNEWKDFFALAEMAGQSLPDDAVVISRKPRIFWALSGKPSRIYPLSNEPDSLFNAARRANANYVVIDRLDRLTQAYLVPVVMRHPEAFCMFYSLGPDRAAILGIRYQAIRSGDDAGEPRQEVSFERCNPN